MANLIVGPLPDYPTVAAAMAAASPGDTITLAPGYVDPLVDPADIITIAGNGANTIVAGEGNNQIITGNGVGNITSGSGNDTMLTGNGANTITTIGGNNFIETGTGVDTIVVGDGFDTILAGSGANKITGLAGDKTIVTNDGADTITVTSGNNWIVAGAGANTIVATSGDNVICTGDEVDTITVTGGNNVISAGDGANAIAATSGQNVIFGGADVDTIVATVGGNYIDGGDGANTLTTDGGDDTIVSGADKDTITTGGGDDLILITGGEDGITGGTGNDTLVVDYSDATSNVITSVPAGTASAGFVGSLSGMGAVTYTGIENFDITSGSGDDTLTTGAGDDRIDSGTGSDVVNTGAGADYIYGNAGDVIDGGSGSDTLNLGLGLTPLNHTIAYDADNNQNGVVTYTDTGETLTFTNIQNVIYEARLDPTIEIQAPTNGMCDPFNVIPCFTPGTSIATAKGLCLVENLKAGDRVITRDNGLQEIAWVGHKKMSGMELIQRPSHKPVFVKAGSLGEGLPDRDMMLSPNHKVLVASNQAKLYFQEREVLVAAKHFIGKPGIHQVDVSRTTYIHFMFERHEVVLSDGAWTESFHPGDYSIDGIDEDVRAEILSLFPALATYQGRKDYGLARTGLKKFEAKLLIG